MNWRFNKLIRFFCLQNIYDHGLCYKLQRLYFIDTYTCKLVKIAMILGYADVQWKSAKKARKSDV